MAWPVDLYRLRPTGFGLRYDNLGDAFAVMKFARPYAISAATPPISARRVCALLLFLVSAGLLAPRLNAESPQIEPAAHGLLRDIDKLQEKLHLKSEQQKLWEIARRKSVETQTEVRAGKRALVEFAELELGHPVPDLEQIARKFEELEERNRMLERESRDLWLSVYAVLTPEQKSLVRQALKTELARYKFFQGLRQRFLE